MLLFKTQNHFSTVKNINMMQWILKRLSIIGINIQNFDYIIDNMLLIIIIHIFIEYSNLCGQEHFMFKTISIKEDWGTIYKFIKRQMLNVTQIVMKSFKMNTWERKYEMYCIIIIIIITMYPILTRILIILEYHIYHNIRTPNLTCIKDDYCLFLSSSWNVRANLFV